MSEKYLYLLVHSKKVQNYFNLSFKYEIVNVYLNTILRFKTKEEIKMYLTIAGYKIKLDYIFNVFKNRGLSSNGYSAQFKIVDNH